MRCRNRSMEMLEWIATWRDHEQQTLDLRDVYSKNKLFLRNTQKKTRICGFGFNDLLLRDDH